MHKCPVTAHSHGQKLVGHWRLLQLYRIKSTFVPRRHDPITGSRMSKKKRKGKGKRGNCIIEKVRRKERKKKEEEKKAEWKEKGQLSGLVPRVNFLKSASTHCMHRASATVINNSRPSHIAPSLIITLSLSSSLLSRVLCFTSH